MANCRTLLENEEINSREGAMLAQHFIQKTIALTLLASAGLAAHAQTGLFSVSTSGFADPEAVKAKSVLLDCNSFFGGSSYGELQSATDFENLACSNSSVSAGTSLDAYTTATSLTVTQRAFARVLTKTGGVVTSGTGDPSRGSARAENPFFFSVNQPFTAVIDMANNIKGQGYSRFTLKGPSGDVVNGNFNQTGYDKLLDSSSLYAVSDRYSYGRAILELTPGDYEMLFYASATVDSAFNQFESQTEASVSISTVPEPSTWALMGLGLVGMSAVMRSRRQGTQP